MPFFPSKLEKPIKPLYILAEENQMTLFKEKFFLILISEPEHKKLIS